MDTAKQYSTTEMTPLHVSELAGTALESLHKPSVSKDLQNSSNTSLTQYEGATYYVNYVEKTVVPEIENEVNTVVSTCGNVYQRSSILENSCLDLYNKDNDDDDDDDEMGTDKLYGEILLRKTLIIIQCSLCFEEFHEFKNYLDHLNKEHEINTIMEPVDKCEDDDLIVFGVDNVCCEPLETKDVKDENKETLNGYCIESDYSTENPHHDKDPSSEDAAAELIVSNDEINQEFISDEQEVEEFLERETLIAFSCSICDSEFEDEAKLIIHIDDHNNFTKDGPQSDMEFQRNGELERHGSQQHRSKSKKIYTCPICDLRISSSWNLKSHILRHSNQNKTKKCEFCHKCFYTNTELFTHQRIHSGEKPFLCTECGNSFSTSSYLSVHMRRHSKIKKYKCDKCGKAFHTKSLLNDHIVSHSKERNFKCPQCSSTFLLRKGLKQHMKIHENKKEYICQYCESAFNQKPGLSAHLKTKHPSMMMMAATE